MLSVALLADAIVSNMQVSSEFYVKEHVGAEFTKHAFQEKAMKAHRAVNAEVILYSYGLGTLYLLTGLLMSGQLWSGVIAFGQNPFEQHLLFQGASLI